MNFEEAKITEQCEAVGLTPDSGYPQIDITKMSIIPVLDVCAAFIILGNRWYLQEYFQLIFVLYPRARAGASIPDRTRFYKL